MTWSCVPMHPDLRWPWLQETNLSAFEGVLSCCLGRTPRIGNAVPKTGLATHSKYCLCTFWWIFLKGTSITPNLLLVISVMGQRISCYVAVSMSRENTCSIIVTIPFPKQSNPRWQWPVQTVPYCEGLNAARGPIVGGRACGDNRFHATSGGQPRKLLHLLLHPHRHWQRTGMVTDTIFSS